jgi:ribosomal-protein-serine acetyltransferase
MFFKQLMPGVVLKMMEERHALEIYSVVDANRHYLREWLPWVDATTSAEITRDFVRKTLRQFAKNEGLHAGIWVDETFAGTIGCQVINWLNRKVEVGYWLSEKAQGRGIMTEATRALVDHSFNELCLNRVQIQCAAGNTRSQAIPRRLGFKEEGRIQQGQRLHGKYHDLIVFGMLRSQWPSTTDAKKID